MLIRFSVENFMSFNDRQEFSMAATKISRHKNHTVSFGKKKVLKGGFIYGANAAGKSNLIKAIQFAVNIVLLGIDNVDFTKKHFRIVPGNYNKPGVFQFDFIVNDNKYEYGFAISYDKKEIIDEWLYKTETNDNEVCIFSRETTESGVIVNSDLRLKGEDKVKFDVYKDDIKRMTKSLFLSDIAKKKINDIGFFTAFNEAYAWFEKIIIIFPDSKYGPLSQITSDARVRQEFEKYLKYFDTGVENVLTSEMDFDKALFDLDEEVRGELRKELVKELSDKPISIRGGNLMLSIYKKDNGEIVAKKMVLDHGNSSDLFDYDDESDGTKRLFDLIPVFFGRKADAIIIIDELDRSFHSQLTLEFVKLFYTLSEKNRSQLIVTTHEPVLMDLEKVRQDEIWFVERKNDHSSIIYSLDKFKQRYDKKVEKDYLIGRYGAVPVFSTFSNVEQVGSEEK